MKRKIRAYLFAAMFVPIFATASSGMSNQCPPKVQPNGLVVNADGTPNLAASDTNKLWFCPSLPYNTAEFKSNPYVTELQDVNFITGSYKCAYKYADSDQYVQSCSYSSQLYKAIADHDKAAVNGAVKDDGTIVVEGVASKKTIDFDDLHPYKIDEMPPLMVAAQKELNEMRESIIKMLEETDGGIIEANDDIKSDLDKIRKLTYDRLVKPHYKPSESDNTRKDYTLSNFLAGLITLDPNVVEGYDPNTGELDIREEWMIESASIKTEYGWVAETTSRIKKLFSWLMSMWYGEDEGTPEEEAEAEEINKALYNGDIEGHKVTSYVQIFKQKIWGFYYLVSERFDIGYTTLSNTLMVLFGGWFIVIGAGREWIKYSVNRGNYEKNLSEAGWLKAIFVASSIGVFWLSMPQNEVPKADATGAMEQNEFRKNYTLAKKMIRKTAQYGANTATMFSDLGLSAFIEYVVHEEQVASLEQIKYNTEKGLEGLYMYTPATALRNECLKYYQTTDKDFFGSSHDLDFKVNSLWKDTDFAKNRNIQAINYDVCQRAFKIYALLPYQLGMNVETVKAQLKAMSPKMSEAMFLMSANAIAMEEKMGWVSAFSIPLEYFIMRNNEMFLTDQIDYDEIKDNASRFMDDVLKDGSDMKRDDVIDATYDYSGKAVSEAMGIINGLFIYNIVPGFTPIQKSLFDYGEKLYGSKLRIYLAERKSKKNNKDKGKGLFSWVKDKLGFGMNAVDGGGSRAQTSKVKGVISTIISMAIPDITSDTLWHSVIYIASYFAAIQIWKTMFNVIFMISISILFLVTFILYFADLIVHFVTSLFMFLWAFTKAGSAEGSTKIMEFVRNTIVIVFAKPSMLVFGAYIFIFVYVMMMTLYAFVFEASLTNIGATVSLLARANGETDVAASYGIINSMGTIAELFMGMFGFFLAYMMILKIPEHFVKKLGTDHGDVTNHQQMVENLASRQDKHINQYA